MATYWKRQSHEGKTEKSMFFSSVLPKDGVTDYLLNIIWIDEQINE